MRLLVIFILKILSFFLFSFLGFINLELLMSQILIHNETEPIDCRRGNDNYISDTIK